MAQQTPHEPQSARSVLMVRPARFGANPATAESNAFQARTLDEPVAAVRARVAQEFDALAAALSAVGVEVCIATDTPDPEKPDAVFPNNWVSFHSDGTIVLYPMLAPNRRPERRLDLLQELAARHQFRIGRTLDLSDHEQRDQYLEGTGSLVLDRVNRIAFAALSPRTHLDALGDFAQQLDYEVVSFEAFNAAGVAIYHTNVLMCVGERFAVLCTDAIADETRARAVVRILETSGHEVVTITASQLTTFAGNMLELENQRGEKVLVMSSAAERSLDVQQRQRLAAHASLVAVEIPTIEHYGGGSVRCMLAELHLPRRK
jgi:hypothetical protein